MKKSKYLVSIDICNNKKLVINSLNGKIAILDFDEYQYLWGLSENHIEKIENEDFVRLGFVTDDGVDEDDVYRGLLKRLKEINMKKKENITNIAIIISYDCNFACPYCYEKSGGRKSELRMNRDMVDRVLQLHPDVTSINFFGGEPFLPENKDIIKYIIEKCPNVKYSAMTNGYYLEEYCEILKDIDVSMIQVTVDGPENIHNRTRILKNGEKTYHKIIRSIDRALKMEIPIKIRMNITNENIDACISLRKEILERYNKYTRFITFELYPVFQTYENQKKVISSKLIKEAFQISEEQNCEIGKLDQVMVSGLPIENFLTSNSGLHPIINYCDAHTDRRFYDPEGNIYSCILSVGNESAAIGTYYPKVTLREDSFINRDVTQIDKCMHCKMALLCGGGCPLALLKNGQSIFQANCSGLYHTINDKIPAIYKGRIDKVGKGV